MSSFFIILSRTVEFVPSEKRKMVTVVHLGLIYQVAKEEWGKDGLEKNISNLLIMPLFECSRP